MVSKAEIRGALLALAGLLVLTLAIMTVTPGLPGELLLQSLRPHLVVAGLVLFVLLLIFGSRWRAIVLLVAVLVVAGQTALLVQELLARRVPGSGTPAAELRVLSYNVLNGNRRAEEAAQFIIDTAPDVAIVMETTGVGRYLDRIATVLPYRVGCEAAASCDLSIHSRHPIEFSAMEPMAPFRLERRAIVRINVDGQPVTIVGVHLSKPYFDEASWVELDQIGRTLSRLEGPVILAGDFNAAPWSNPLVALARREQLEPGPWMPASWPVVAGPLGVPIDNIFARGGAHIETLEAGESSFGSNHRPILARVSIYPAD